ncbi:Cation/acetate symporter ActP [compost metagenome]|uniref:sodium:solute symporter family protein n=1 Tax=Achromobacter sp. Root83 TaxID=1736602 RepID=UPI00070C6C65|nr:sodium:solute symporter family protein [Achromobacter sp. Root83]KRC68842.1 sodium:solute symporter [Achromobacter sp. Root83]
MPFFSGDTPQQFRIRLRRIYVLYTAGFALMILLMALAEILGMPRNWIGYVFLLVTVSLYAGIGIVCRTSDQVEYYVAGRRVPAIYNGMATAADWMSVASFIGVAGTLYLTGYGGLAYIMGWTGGYVLVAMLLAPYLRRFGQYTIPDFMGARYGGNLPRLAGVACAILCSFTYLVAQIYGVGIITTRMTGISFELGIFVALGGMLVCSFLGGMRAVTWTQVGQYIILVIAYLVPVVWLSIKHTNMPLPQLSAGAVLQQVTEKEVYLQNDPSEIEVRRLWQQHADEMARRVEALPESWALEKDKLRSRLAQLNASEAPMVDIRSAERELASYPPTVEDARVAWSQSKATFEARAAPPTPHAEPFPAKDPEERRNMRVNFLALVLCLMLGTAGMPHILMRSYTTPSVIEARKSVCWSLLFILLLYFMAPALALLVKYEVYTQVVGSNFLSLPNWVHAWSAVDTNLLDVTDINRDGVVQLSEISMGADVVVLAMPEIGGLPYVISGLVAAGGLAAALSTADGLLLTLSNSLSHDMWYRMVSPRMSAARRVMVSKILLLVVAFGAAWVAARKPADILFMVSAAFSFAASSFFPALVMGVFWRRANKWGATLGMAAGLAVTFAYMTHTHPWLRESVLGISRTQPVDLWWGIQPIAAGIFGAPVAFLTIVVVSLLTPPPDRATLALVDYLRNPAARNPQAENT